MSTASRTCLRHISTKEECGHLESIVRIKDLSSRVWGLAYPVKNPHIRSASWALCGTPRRRWGVHNVVRFGSYYMFSSKRQQFIAAGKTPKTIRAPMSYLSLQNLRTFATIRLLHVTHTLLNYLPKISMGPEKVRCGDFCPPQKGAPLKKKLRALRGLLLCLGKGGLPNPQLQTLNLFTLLLPSCLSFKPSTPSPNLQPLQPQSRV